MGLISIRLAIVFQMYVIARNSKTIWPYNSSRSSILVSMESLLVINC